MKWLLIPIALVLMGCGGPRPDDESAAPIGQVVYVRGVYVTRFHDDELGATCWVTTGGYQGGISCLPDAQLKGTDR